MENNDTNTDGSIYTKISKRLIGLAGENSAAEFIEQMGLKVIKRNYRCPTGEMDIIALQGPCLVFIEVRTRTSAVRGWGEESITAKKRQRLFGIAKYYIKESGFKFWPEVRFDLIAIRWPKQEDKPEIEWLKGIF